jgi:hypothetical protein
MNQPPFHPFPMNRMARNSSTSKPTERGCLSRSVYARESALGTIEQHPFAAAAAGTAARRPDCDRELPSGCARTSPSQRISLLLIALVSIFSAVLPIHAQEAKKSAFSAWERSIVTIEIARRDYDYYQPWVKRTSRLQKTGLVAPDREILTTADGMFDSTLVRLQRGGRGPWFTGEIKWIDYHANLAIVSVADAEFWRDLKPAAFGGSIPASGALEILRWRDGRLENRSAEFMRFTVSEQQLSQINQVALEADSEIQNVGWGEPLVANSKVVGLVRARENRTCVAMPASVIQSILEARKKGQYHGLGFFHFFWEPAENPTVFAQLKLPGPPRGVVIIDVPPRQDGCEEVLKPRDILLSIDGFKLDPQGDYQDPEFGALTLEGLSTRRKWAGDTMSLELWREGKPLTVSYRLPKYDYTNSLLPHATYDQEPEYLIVGGLVFQPLTTPYLRGWGAEWKSSSPFRLRHYDDDRADAERPALMVLSQVLPDAYNIGYQELRALVVDKVNGQRISRLSDLRQALQKPVDGFHIIDFMPSDSLKRLVLGAGDSQAEATARVLKRYGIAQESNISAASKTR